MTKSRIPLYFVILTVFALVLAACQSATPAPQPTTAPPTAVPTEAAAEPAMTPSVMQGAQINVGEKAGLGTFLTDAKGMTLYIFLKDEPGKSNCYDACAQNWPPLLTEGAPVAGEGVDASLLGTTERTDGSMQVTYNGYPLYYWVNDAAPGDTNGQGVKDVWFVISPAGDTVMQGAQINVGEKAGLGTFLTDAKGMTLYIFLKDEPGKSNCYDACAQNWPPLLTEGAPVAGEGVDASLLGTTERTDGSMQVTYNGYPLYYWVNDAAPGDTNGQGVKDVWFVISPAGEIIK